MILVIDNYDSFTYNLVHYLQELGETVVVKRNDALTSAEAIAMAPDAIVLSPGPCTPNEAGICLDLLAKAPASLPILGVCLGHQSIGQAFGGKVVSAKHIMHGKTCKITNTGAGMFEGLPSEFIATRYHSLAVERDSLPDCLIVDAETADGEIMAMHHRDRPIYGLQFHPESIASEHGHDLLAKFLQLARMAHAKSPA